MKKTIVNLAYVAIALTVIGQVTVGHNFYIGQIAYLVANIVNCGRDLALGRPRADKIKDISCTAITLGLLGMYFL